MVEFKMASSAQRARELIHGKELEGRKIYVKMDAGDNRDSRFNNMKP